LRDEIDQPMPELPEVETTRLGLLPYVQGQRISKVIVRDRRLRWPVPVDFARRLKGRTVRDVLRRGKYLLWDCETGYLLSHLGMSGSLRVVPAFEVAARHDHIDLAFENGNAIRYTDPRRFGAMLWISGRKATHPLLAALGPEPLEPEFNAAYLASAARNRSVSIKEFVMNSRVVVGVGNIYASESLFLAGIHPARIAGKMSLARCERLAFAIKQTLAGAIRAGGSSLRDYVQANGELGTFQVNAYVYGRDTQPCRVCRSPIRAMRQGQRSTYFCPACQT
jgi:formamidopyrimidine-DNA glycosylase